MVDNALKTKKRKFAAHVFRALSTTEEEDITCGHTLTWKMNDHLDDITLEHCSTVTSSRSIIFSINRTATLAQTLAALLTLFDSQKRHAIKEMMVTDATKCHQYGYLAHSFIDSRTCCVDCNEPRNVITSFVVRKDIPEGNNSAGCLMLSDAKQNGVANSRHWCRSVNKTSA